MFSLRSGMDFRRIVYFIKKRFKRRKMSLSYDFLRQVEPALNEIMHDIEDLNYNQKTFDLIGSNTCLMQINALILELKNLIEDLFSLEKRFKYSSNYSVLSEIEDAKRFCHQGFIDLYDIFSLIQSSSVDSISNETLLSIISRLEKDVRKIDDALKKIRDTLVETQHTHFEINTTKDYIDISAIHSESKIKLMQSCMIAYEGLMSMPFLDKQEMAYVYLEKYKIAMENLMKCLAQESLSTKQFDAICYDLISSLESIRFCLNRETKIGKTLEIKVKLITQNVKKAASQVDIKADSHSLQK